MSQLRMKTALAVAMVTMLLSLPPMQAGTQESPEVMDATGDTSHSSASRDIVSFWIDDEIVDDTLWFNLLVGASFEHVAAAYANHEHYRVGFVPTGVGALAADKVEMYVIFRPNVDTGTGNPGANNLGCHFGTSAQEGGYQDIAEETIINGGQVLKPLYRCPIPVELVGDFDSAAGDTLATPWVVHRQVQRGPTTGGDENGVNVVATYDRAPDQDYGFTYGASDTGPETRLENLVGSVVDIGESFANSTNLTVVYNWTAPAGNYSWSYVAQVASGNISVNIVDADNATVVDQLIDNSTSLEETPLQAAAGNWTLSVAYANFTGNFSLRVDSAYSPPAMEPSPSASPGNETNTTTPPPEDAGAPGLAAPLVISAFVMALLASARRRRNYPA